MRVVIQRVKKAHVEVEGKILGEIGTGLLILLGIHQKDQPSHTQAFVSKILNLRIFEDEKKKMNKSLLEIKGEALVISQFTLYANCTRGRRPDFFSAASPALAESIYQKFIAEVEKDLGRVQTGQFGANMQVYLINDGPVTLTIDSS